MASAQVLQHASELLRCIDGLSEAPLDEVSDLRKELKQYLTPFRGFVLEQAKGSQTTADAPVAEQRRAAVLNWETNVAPAIQELRATIGRSRYLSQLMQVVGNGPDAAVGIGMGIVGMVAASSVGFTALAGLGMAAAPSLAKAAAARSAAKQDIASSPVLFVVEAEKRLKDRVPRLNLP